MQNHYNQFYHPEFISESHLQTSSTFESDRAKFHFVRSANIKNTALISQISVSKNEQSQYSN